MSKRYSGAPWRGPVNVSPQQSLPSISDKLNSLTDAGQGSQGHPLRQQRQTHLIVSTVGFADSECDCAANSSLKTAGAWEEGSLTGEGEKDLFTHTRTDRMWFTHKCGHLCRGKGYTAMLPFWRWGGRYWRGVYDGKSAEVISSRQPIHNNQGILCINLMMWWCENLFSRVSFTSAGEAVSCWPLDPIKLAPLIRNLASIRKLALSITPAVLTIRTGAIFFKSENRTVTNSFFLSLKNCRRNFLKGKPGPMTVSEHIDTLPVGGRACFPHCRTLNNNLTKTLALKLTWISQKIKMVAFIYIKYESKCSLKIHQSLSQIYQNLPIVTFLPPHHPSLLPYRSQ